VKIICCLSRKGGVGKSLTARSLAVAGLFDDTRTAVLDADPQGSILSWVERREPPAPRVFPLEGTIAATITAIRKGKPEYIFIDTPPSVHPVIDMAVQAADIALIITGPYPEDLAAIGSSVQVVKSRKKRAGIILNRTPIRSSALSLARSALGVFEIPICPTAIVQRVAHPYAASTGMTAQEWEPEGAAAKEIENVWKWVKAQLNG
jgi:chromosome partitioning protein